MMDSFRCSLRKPEMEYLAVQLDGTMAFDSRSKSDFSPPSGSEAAFEQLLRLAAAYASQRSSATLDTQDGRTAARKNPIAQDIEQRAYHIYLQRGSAHGYDLDDWLQAERQVFAGLKNDKASLRLALAFGLLKEAPRE